MGRDLQEVAATVVGWANEGEQVEALVTRSSSTIVVVYDGRVETLESATSEGVGIRVVVGDRQGVASATILDEGVLKEVLEEARDNAAFASPDEHVGLAAPDGVEAVDIDLVRDDLASMTTEAKIDLALDLERRVKSADPRIRAVPRSRWFDAAGESALASTTGIATYQRSTRASMSTYCLAGSDDETQTGAGVTAGRGLGELDVEKPARDAVERALRMLGARKPPSARLTVVLDPEITADFLGVLAGPLNGESVLKGRSLFAGRLGQEVASGLVTLFEDPTNPLAYGAGPYDAEGLASRRVPLITAGVLDSFLYNSYAARRAGAVTTASASRAGLGAAPGVAPRALSLEPGRFSFEELLAEVGEGLLVQSVSGLHSGVNPISGDFSVGAEGVRITGGALGEPVREMTIGSTIQRMLQGVVAVGNDVEWLPGAAAGVSLAIADVSMSGV